MIISVYKPKGLSSYDVIRKLKRKYSGQKIGHGGTLDPLAEGVVVIGVGPGTKKLQEVLKGTDKVYEATIELGKVSQTDDAEGPIEQINVANDPTMDEVTHVLSTFEGTIEQVPPKYSAVKIRGMPAYKRARRGEEFTIQSKQVTIKQIKLSNYSYPLLQIQITVSSGFYVRSLARDIGEKLGTGAYLKKLVRTQVGNFAIGEAMHIQEE